MNKYYYCSYVTYKGTEVWEFGLLGDTKLWIYGQWKAIECLKQGSSIALHFKSFRHLKMLGDYRKENREDVRV